MEGPYYEGPGSPDSSPSLLSAREELICPLCLGTFNEPRSLRCLHSYCEECLVGLLKVNARKDLLSCPECRKNTPLQPEGIRGLPINFKLRRLVEILTAEEKRELIRKGSQRKLSSAPKHSMCLIHQDKTLDFFCEPCGVLICGQCMLDEHRIHGNVKYASEVLALHVAELKLIIPDAEEVITSGKEAIMRLLTGSKQLNDTVTERVTNVSMYFANLRDILDGREKEVLQSINTHAKRKEKQISRSVNTLQQAVENMTKSKMVLEDAVTRRAKECSVLQEEAHIRARVQASMRLVDEEVMDSQEKAKNLTNLSAFKANPTLEEMCKGLSYDPSSPVQRRSKTAIEQRDTGLSSSEGLVGRRERSGAVYVGSAPMNRRKLQRPLSSTFSGHDCHPMQLIGIPSSPTGRMSPITGQDSPILKPKRQHSFNILEPAVEISTRNLIGPCNTITAFPFGVCCSLNGTLLVTDVKHHLFRVVTATGKCRETIGSEGKGDGQFLEPAAIAVDREGSILVVDRKSPGRVQKFSSSGQFTSKFKMGGLLGRLSMAYVGEPYGITTLSNGSVLVTDGEKACVHQFEESGRYGGKFGNLTDLKCPAGITANENRVVLVDKGAHSLYILTRHGQPLKRVGQQGSAPGDLYMPFGVALDTKGYIIVSEYGNHRISVFTPGGNFVRCFGGKGMEPGMFNAPRHVCFNSQGQLVVCDEENQRLQLFEMPSYD